MRRNRNMHGFMALAMLLVVFAVAGTPATATDVTYNGQTIVISQPGTYVLKNDITNSNNVICIEIKASNVVFDGGGHLIDGVDDANKAGIYAHNDATVLEGVTVKNVRMQDWYYGIYFNAVKNSKVEQSSILSNSFGGIVMYKDSTGNTVSGNRIIDNAYGVIFSDGASNGVISNNEIRNNERGLYVYLSDGFTVTGNQVTGNINNGIQLHTSGSGSIYNNNLNNNLNVFFFGEPFRANAWSVTPRAGTNIMNGPSIGGNFWGTPSGAGYSQVTPDSDGDGFVDGSVTIAEGNVDAHPLAAWTGPTPTGTVTVTPTATVGPVNQTPYKPHTLPTRIETEDYDLGGEGVAYHDVEAANLGKAYRLTEGVDIEKTAIGNSIGYIRVGEWIEYTVNIPTAGAYPATFRVAGWATGRQIAFAVDGVSTATVNVPNTGSYTKWQSVTVPVMFQAGRHVIRLSFNGDKQNLDYVEFGASTQPTVQPTTTTQPTQTQTQSGQNPFNGPHAVPGRVQAEDFDNGGKTVAYSDSTPENKGEAYRLNEAVDIETVQGGGYNIGYITNGEWVEYTVNVPSAGTYQTAFRTGSWFSGTRQIKVSVAGAEKATVTVPVTGKDYLYQTVTVPVTLAAGTQVIRLTFVGEKQNLDYFEIGAGTTTTGTPTVEPTATVTVQPTETSTVEPTETVTVEPTQTVAPSGRSIPGRIEAENFDEGAAGTAYRDLTPGNQGDYTARNPTDVDLETLGSGANVGYIRTGEWLVYTANVAQTNSYLATFRVGSWTPPSQTPGQRTIMVRVDNAVEKAVNVPLTGSSSAYETVSIPLDLSQGTHEIGIRFVGWYQNFDWMEFAPAN